MTARTEPRASRASRAAGSGDFELPAVDRQARGLERLSGYGLHAVGLELDAIAAVVIGGILLTGGVGYVAGTLLGVGFILLQVLALVAIA